MYTFNPKLLVQSVFLENLFCFFYLLIASLKSLAIFNLLRSINS